jgi:hypothetical protein
MSKPPHLDALDVVMFPAGGWQVGFEARHVRSARPAGPDASSEGGNEIETLLGLPHSSNPSHLTQWLDLKQTAENTEILVAGPVELRTLPVASIHPLPPLLAARSQLNGLRALVLQENTEQIALLFDVPQLRCSISAALTLPTD